MTWQVLYALGAIAFLAIGGAGFWLTDRLFDWNEARRKEQEPELARRAATEHLG